MIACVVLACSAQALLYGLRSLKTRDIEAQARKLEVSSNARAIELLRDEFEAHQRMTEKAVQKLVKEIKETVGTFADRLQTLETRATGNQVQPQSWQKR